jgi:hypothetical protein
MTGAITLNYYNMALEGGGVITKSAVTAAQDSKCNMIYADNSTYTANFIEAQEGSAFKRFFKGGCVMLLLRNLDTLKPRWYKAKITEINDDNEPDSHAATLQYIGLGIFQLFYDVECQCPTEVQLSWANYGDIQEGELGSEEFIRSSNHSPRWFYVVNAEQFQRDRTTANENVINDFVDKNNRAVVDVPGDGCCGYHVCCRQLKIALVDLKDSLIKSHVFIIELLEKTVESKVLKQNIDSTNLNKVKFFNARKRLLTRMPIHRRDKKKPESLRQQYWFGGKDSTDFIALAHAYQCRVIIVDSSMIFVYDKDLLVAHVAFEDLHKFKLDDTDVVVLHNGHHFKLIILRLPLKGLLLQRRHVQPRIPH